MRKLATVICLLVMCCNANAAEDQRIILLKPMGLTKADDKDLTIKKVYAGSPAEQAGIEVGDEILKTNKKVFSSNKKLLEYLDKLEDGKEAIFEVRRGNEKKSIAVIPRNEMPRYGFSCLPPNGYIAENKSTVTGLTGNKSVFIIGNPRIGADGTLCIDLGVRNTSDKDIAFDPNQIRVLADGMPLKVLSPEEVINMDFAGLSEIAKLPPLQPVQVPSSISQNMSGGGPSGSYTITGSPGQIRVEEDAAVTFAKNMQAASQIRIEQFKTEIAAYPMRKREELEALMINREKQYMDASRRWLRNATIKPGESNMGVMVFNDPYKSTNIRIEAKVEDDVFMARFAEYKRVKPE